ncbi:cell division protein FtsQ [Pedobacter sp. UYP30]|uniref:cell division protein FtsQ/DivIB n=1 Tax=Pedobacter sp. UYP30 TaxID=1756400 RepID=UPI00339897E2
MLKKINFRAILTGFAWLVSLAGVVLLLSFINVKKQSVKCSNVKILIPGADNFIERDEIDAILRQSEGMLVGRNLEQINIHKIEKRLQANPYIAFAKVFVDMDGTLHINVSQRKPILRVLNDVGQDFYIDNKGLKMPISSNFTADVLVASGNIKEFFGSKVDTLRTQLAKDLYKTAMYIQKDSLWNAQMEQVYVDEKGDIELVPRVGNQRIILGDADSLDRKMNNLLLFYKKAMPQVGWNTYKTINVKYTNQIVCVKRDSSEKSSTRQEVVHKPDSLIIQKKVTDSLVRDVIAEAMKNNKTETKSTSPPAPKKEQKPKEKSPPKSGMVRMEVKMTKGN